MIVPIYVAWLEIEDAYGKQSWEFERSSYEPIPDLAWPGPNESTWIYRYGEKPRYWIKTPPLAKLIVDEFGQTVLLLSGKKVSGLIAWVLLSAARRGDPQFRFVSEPKSKDAVA
jgi:hypothetical protein